MVSNTTQHPPPPPGPTPSQPHTFFIYRRYTVYVLYFDFGKEGEEVNKREG